MEPSLPLFLFDGECGFCRKWTAWMQARLPESTMSFVPYQSVDLARFRLKPNDVRTASYFIDERGQPYRGNRSFSQSMLRAHGSWRLVGVVAELPVIRCVLVPVYRAVVWNRHRLPAPD